MGWEDQGRQDHGWFGHGTGPGGEPAASGKGLFDPGHLGDRAAAAVHGSLAALPRVLRAQGGTVPGAGPAERLPGLLARWAGASSLADATFAQHFFDRHADDRAVLALHSAAREVAGARDHDDLRRASEHVAGAMQVAGSATGGGSWRTRKRGRTIRRRLRRSQTASPAPIPLPMRYALYTPSRLRSASGWQASRAVSAPLLAHLVVLS